MVSSNVQFILLIHNNIFLVSISHRRSQYLRFCYDAWWFAAQMLNLGRVTRPTALSSHVAAHSAIIFSLLSVPLCLLVQGTAWHQKVIFIFHMFFFTFFFQCSGSMTFLCGSGSDPRIHASVKVLLLITF
jgi:hypothetical protein